MGKPKNPAGIYSSTQNDPRGTTDLSIIFPTESIIQHAKAIQVRGEEIAVTGSQDSLEAGELINTGDNEMVLPLQEAYLIIPTESRDLITQLLKKYNFSDAWINQHTRTIDFNRGSHPSYNYTVLAENRESITKWLKEHRQSLNKKLTLRQLPCKSKQNNIGNLYSANLI